MLKKFLRFGLLSGGGWLLDCTLLLAFASTQSIPVFAANFVSSSVAALTVFVVSRYVVFSSTESALAGRMAVYFVYTAGVIVLASVVIGEVREVVRVTTGHLGVRLDSQATTFLAKVIITPPQLVANFFVSRVLNENRA